jgi:PQQ-dependent dehydrogenase (methanol/ethanol family)
MQRIAACGCLVVALCAWDVVGFGQAPPRSQAPSFTEAQSGGGSAAYRQHCASCHGAQLEGLHLSPALTGERFDRAWGGKTADALMFQLRRMPPQQRAGSPALSDETYTAILAYLLEANGQAASDKPLPSDMKALAALTIPRLAAASSDVDAPIAKSSGAAARLSALSPVTDKMLHNPPAGDWLQWGRTYDGQNYSPLKLITKNNVENLRPAWRTPLRGGTSMPTPIVHDGVIFLQTIPDTVLAIDGASGDILWRYQYKAATQASRKMGLALQGDRVIVPTSDLHVVALNGKNGEVIWDHPIQSDAPTTGRGQLQLRSAPLIVKDKIIQGVTSSFTPGGGFILALDVNSGQELWRFYTIARPGEPGGETWNGLPLDKRSGGSVWHQGTYDAELNLIYFGAAPTYDTGLLLHPSGEPGTTSDALYTNCTIALNPDTGKLVWYFQHVPNDQWDLDWVFERQIVTTTIDGRRRKVILNVGKMAILDVLDAATGEYLYSVDSGTQNVITFIDPKTGAKTIDRSKWPDPNRPAVVCPGVSGARAWPPTSFSPQTSFLYLPLTEWCNNFGAEGSKLLTSGVGISSAEHPASADGMMGRVQAIDVKGKKLSWVHRQPSPVSTSLLATAGGVVFSGDLDPGLKAFDDATGKILWQAKLDDLPSGSIVTYTIGRTQYIAVVVGLRNNHVGDLSRTYNAFRKRRGDNVETPSGGAALWVFKE